MLDTSARQIMAARKSIPLWTFLGGGQFTVVPARASPSPPGLG